MLILKLTSLASNPYVYLYQTIYIFDSGQIKIRWTAPVANMAKRRGENRNVYEGKTQLETSGIDGRIILK
jgi:hypothetical protein